ncbi:hypothetical protein WICMUC_002989 [Wickerhamomyces mucosus]|uniref:Ubiquitin carboxyl-terminal hydrolase n=1 Tax=Wickerhamomyces mucosus TaxID=1378264 RepID=A0A9P8PMJ9_9ASCO|nr:hypothetical protein WICMUC_002989 [Wickerhamomyces mucosus]
MPAVIPLESNPEVFTQFAHFLGLSPSYQYNDVFSINEPDLLALTPRPSESIILLFPITEKYEELRKEEEKNEGIDGDDVKWFKQSVKNACGLFALLNSISNLSNDSYLPDSLITKFIGASGDTSKVESLIQEFQSSYDQFATSGSTEAPDANDEVNLHFISFIKKNGKIYELDGRRTNLLKIGEANDPEFSDVLGEEVVLKRINQYIDLTDDENKLKFSIIALGPSFD